MPLPIRSRLACACLVAGALAWNVGNARAQDFNIKAWQAGDGLPQNTVEAVAQTRDGYLWLGTQNGLARFDGVRFVVFGLRDGLRSLQVRALLEDRDGALWIGTTGGGLSRMASGRIETFSVADGLPSENVTALAEGEDGRLWVGTSSGLAVREGKRFASPAFALPWGRRAVRVLRSDPKGGLWIAGQELGLSRLEEDRLAPVPGPLASEATKPATVYCVLEDRQGNVWASVGNGIVWCRRQGQWVKYDTSAGLPFAYVTCLAETRDGTVWAGSLDAGLYFFRNDRFEALRRRDGLKDDAVRALLEDREGHLWIGTRAGGLHRLTRPELTVLGAAAGLTNDYVRGLAETADGAFWVAASGGGIYRGRAATFMRMTGDPLMEFYPFVEPVLALGNGRVWWGGSQALLCWQEDRLAAAHTAAPWVKNAVVRALCEDGAGGLWAGTSRGALVRVPEIGEPSAVTNFAGGGITALLREPEGALWVGSVGGGLHRFHQGAISTLRRADGLLSDSILALHRDAEQTLWIGTVGGGLTRLKQKRLTPFGTREGLPDDTVSVILEDDRGDLWLGSNRGICRVRKGELDAVASGRGRLVHPLVFGAAEGMPTEECSGGFSPAGLKTKAGLLAFPTVKGVVLIDPNRTFTPNQPPVTRIEETLVDGQVVAARPAALDAPPGVLIPPGRHNVEIRYTALNFGAPERIRFRYRIDRVDADWVEAGTRRVAYYNQLPPGEYRFEVTAIDSEGNWSNATAGLALTLRPFVWQTRWFLLASAGLVLAALALAIRHLAQRKLRRRLEAIELQHAVEKERTRIAKDIHDDIGTSLTQILLLSDLGRSRSADAREAGQQFERIAARARAVVESLDEIVWAVNPRNDNLPNFADYLSRFAHECFELTPIRCWHEVPVHLPAVSLSTDLRHNLFLAAKEALHNALKHSGALEVWVRLSLEDGELRLAIEDNGRGFVAAEARPGGSGLKNIRARLAEAGGRMELQTAPGQGVKVCLIVPVAGASPKDAMAVGPGNRVKEE